MMGLIDVDPVIKHIAGLADPDMNPLGGQNMLDVIVGIVHSLPFEAEGEAPLFSFRRPFRRPGRPRT
jgi:hypothetical protein